VFCKLVRRQGPVSVVFEDSEVLAFLDIKPVNPGHALVIPKQHVKYLADLPRASGAKLFERAMAVAEAIRNSHVKSEGMNLFLADGVAAGQEVFHVHLHVIPRYPGDGFGLRFGPHYGTMPARSELDRVAAEIRSAIGSPHP
jgi:histidine triad (HIT) family protein